MSPHSTPAAPLSRRQPLSSRRPLPRWLFFLIAALMLLGVLALVAVLGGRVWLRAAARNSLPVTSGSLTLPALGTHPSALSAPVSIARDSNGIPTVSAQTYPDLLVAQGFTTAQDRLFQMDTFRRHAAGELAEILGPKLLPHDRAQRILSLGPAADRILTQLPPDQLQALQHYADGVNSYIALVASGTAHPGDARSGLPTGTALQLPLEFRVLGYQPRPWQPRDSILVALALFQDLTNVFPTKLSREALTGSFQGSPQDTPQLLADLYPVGSWRDHPPSQPATDLTTPTDFIDIPLDESQTLLKPPPTPSVSPSDLRQLTALFSPFCPSCRRGSNNWAVSGAHSGSGKPLFANDMHLNLTAPGFWYTIALQTPAGTPTHFDVSGVSLPGVPWIVVGHNQDVAWGFTNLGADVQDLYLEHLQADTFATATGPQHLHHRSELIRVRGGRNLSLDVRSTVHNGVETPLLNSLLPSETRPISLRWSLFDTNAFSLPFAAVNTASSAPALAEALRTYTGPTQNLIAADSSGHILYHGIGRIPVRGSLSAPAPLSPVPTDSTAPDAAAHEWAGFIPYDQLPTTLDPTGGVLATANSRITPDNYPYPVTLDWAGPYRNERIWHQLTGTAHLTTGDMRRLQVDVFSDSDQRIAHRFAYAIDHTPSASSRLRAAADILRSWDGEVLADTPAPALVGAARSALWQLLLAPHLPGTPANQVLTLYTWGERDFAQEQLIAHTPARWLPSAYPTWDALLAAAVDRGLTESHAPRTLSRWRYNHTNPTQLELPLFAQAPILERLIGLPTGSPALDLSGNGNTIRQTHHNFGPSEHFAIDLGQPAEASLALPLGQSGNPASPFLLNQLPAWLSGDAFPLSAPPAHTLRLAPR